MAHDMTRGGAAPLQETTIYRVIYHRIDEPAGTLRSAWFDTMQDAQAFTASLEGQAQVYGLNTEWVPSNPKDLVAWLNNVAEASPLNY